MLEKAEKQNASNQGNKFIFTSDQPWPEFLLLFSSLLASTTDIIFIKVFALFDSYLLHTSNNMYMYKIYVIYIQYVNIMTVPYHKV